MDSAADSGCSFRTMDIRKKHIFFGVCTILAIYAVVLTFVLVRKLFVNNEQDHCIPCFTCNVLSQNDKLHRQLVAQQKLTLDCAQKYLRHHHWEGKRDQVEYGLEADAPDEQEEKIDFHEFLVQEIFAPDSIHTERRK